MLFVVDPFGGVSPLPRTVLCLLYCRLRSCHCLPGLLRRWADPAPFRLKVRAFLVVVVNLFVVGVPLGGASGKGAVLRLPPFESFVACPTVGCCSCEEVLLAAILLLLARCLHSRRRVRHRVRRRVALRLVLVPLLGALQFLVALFRLGSLAWTAKAWCVSGFSKFFPFVSSSRCYYDHRVC